MTEYAGSGDARRSMALLWGRHDAPTRGPKQGLTVARITAAAIELADREGLSAVSMRRVGERLGTSAMALYTYVPAKSELFDLMLDTVLGELPDTYDDAAGWRVAAEAWADEIWAFHLRHPWTLQISVARPLLGPNELDAQEAQLRIFDDIGLSAVEVKLTAGALSSFVSGAASAVAHVRAAEADTGKSEDDWWHERSALLDELGQFDWNERYPTASKLEAAQAFEQSDPAPGEPTGYLERETLAAFRFGLARLLDGIDALVATRRK